MVQTFSIAKSSKLDNLFLIGDKSKVSEEVFWDYLSSKVKEITASQPEKYEETLERAKAHLINTQTSLTVLDAWFQIKGKASTPKQP